jgi:two-component sensor histidine kinase
MMTPATRATADVHLDNVAANLQLVADLAYAAMALAVPREDGMLAIVADAHPATAVAPIATSRVGQFLDPDDEPEAYATLHGCEPEEGTKRRVMRGIQFDTAAFPVGGVCPPIGVVIRYRARQVTLSPGTMETAFMEAAADVIKRLCEGPLMDLRTHDPFSTVRRAGDGVMRVNATSHISYASPNAVNIMRFAGVIGALTGRKAAALPGGGFGIAPALGTGEAIAVDAEVGDRVLGFRTVALEQGAVVLFEDRTEAWRREAEIKVKETTIREVHHRVKNNLQTIASLLRIQARRTRSDEAREALSEAVERVSSMAVVHDMLSGNDEERIDFTTAARTVVDLVKRGLLGGTSDIDVTVTGSTGMVDAQVATSLALALAEIVHNAIEHGPGKTGKGSVEVAMRRLHRELVLTVRDDGPGLPADFDVSSASNMGLAIVRTIVEDDLRGTLGFAGAKGTIVTIRILLTDSE